MTPKQVIQKSIEYRGVFIHEMSRLEKVIDLFIATYFCGSDKTKQTDMLLFILGDERVSLMSKSQIFYQIAISKYKDWYDAYQSISKGMNKDIMTVIENRNIFAHRIVEAEDISKEVPETTHIESLKEGDIRFVKLKDKVSVTTFNDKLLQEQLSSIISLTAYIGAKVPLI